MSGRLRSAWERWALPTLIEKACRSSVILEERRRLVPRAHGRVLELGVGSGLNLPFYDEARVTAFVGVDPSPGLLEKARARLRASPLRGLGELVLAPGERLPFEDESFDSAVMTYTLCSVADPLRVLGEIRRVLRPGAPLFFVEHGLASEPRTARLQRLLTPAWRTLSGNCHLDRDIAAALASADFELPELAARFTEGTVKAVSFTYEGKAEKTV